MIVLSIFISCSILLSCFKYFIFKNTEIINESNYQKYIDDFYLDICNLFNSSYNSTYKFQNDIYKNNIFQKNLNKNKSWFTDELYQIRNRIIELKHITVPLSSNSNVSDIRTEIKRQKNNFRRIQRQNIYLAEAKELDKLEYFLIFSHFLIFRCYI